MDDAVDREAADAVFLGEIGQGHLTFGVAAPDGACARGRQFGLSAAELALPAGLGHAFTGPQVAEVSFELGDHGQGLQEQPAEGVFPVVTEAPRPKSTSRSDRSVRMACASATSRAKRSNLVTVRMLPGQSTARAWSRPVRLMRRVPEKPRSM
jgi:hypothetical protein